MCRAQINTRNQTVSTNTKMGKSLLIAIPSYNDRIFPRFDQAHYFHFAKINLAQRTIETMTTHRWPTQEQDVCCWLVKMGVQGVLCSGIHHRHQIRFQQAGIWLVWGLSGNIESTLQHWLKDQPAMVNKNRHAGFDHTDLSL